TTGAPAAEYTMGSSFMQGAAAAAVAAPAPKAPAATPPPPPPAPPAPAAEASSPNYYGEKFESEELVQDDIVDKMEDSYDLSDPYGELELEEEPETSSSYKSSTGTPIQEVEPIAEFDDSSTAESTVLEFEDDSSSPDPEFEITPEEPPGT